MVAKFPNHHIFLDEDGHLDCRTMKVWATAVLLGAIMSFMSIQLFLPYLQDHGLFAIQTLKNDFYSLLEYAKKRDPIAALTCTESFPQTAWLREKRENLFNEKTKKHSTTI